MSRSPWLAAGIALIALVLWCVAPPASAQTLDEALGAAYLGNPQLRAARAQLRATDAASSATISMNPRASPT